MEKINLVEILKDCPRGMELECTSYDNVSFDKISDDKKATYPIFCYITDKEGNRSSISFTENGCESKRYGAKCVIFPKGKTTWEGFIPCKFKAGDVIVSETGNIVLFSHIDIENIVHYHCIIPTYGSFRIEENTSVGVGKYYDCVLANERQRQKMYAKIECSGHKYNQSTNKLEKSLKPKFKIGDKVRKIGDYISGKVVDFDKDYFYKIEYNSGCVSYVNINAQDDWELFPTHKFKVGDRIVNDGYLVEIIEVDIEGEVYGYKSKIGGIGGLLFIDQDDWELVPDKFDPTTLKPFDKVLTRCSSLEKWRIQFFEKFDKTCSFPFICVGYNKYKQCIPYEGNEHLLDTTDSCSEYYQI